MFTIEIEDGREAPCKPSMCICINTGLLGGFAPIFYFNCEHFLFVYIVKQKKLVDFIKMLQIFNSKLSANRILLKANF